MLINIIGWFVYGIIVGLIAKAIHPGEDPVGLLPTVAIGVAGSYMGGAISWAMGFGLTPLQPSGIILGIIGGVICLMLWRWYKLRQGNKSFLSGKPK